MQSYVNHKLNSQRIDFQFQFNYFTLVKRHFRSKNNWLGEKQLTFTWTDYNLSRFR